MTGNISPIKKTLTPEQKLIAEFNQIYTTLVHGGKNYVLRQNTDAFGHAYLEFFNHKEFVDAHKDQPKVKITVLKEDGSSAVKMVNPAKFWLENPDSMSAKYGLTFHPVNTRFHNGKLNTYMGLGCEPLECEELDVNLYLEHVKNIICNGDLVTYEYVINWLAHLIQKPWEKPEVAIVLKAGQGTGKGTFIDPLGQIIGSHYLHAQSPEQVIGKFNAQLENKLLVFADEFFAGSKSSTDRLKTMITERVNTIERKGQDRITVPCFARIIMATNHDNVIKIERDERRYLYLEVSEDMKQNSEYFNKLHSLIKSENFPSKLFFYLQTRDITVFEPRKVPKTAALTDQKIDNLEPLDKWIYNILLDGEFSINTPWPPRIQSSELHEKAEKWLELNKLSVWGDLRTKVGILMKKLECDALRVRTSKTKLEKYTTLPELKKIRANFEKYINAEINWEPPEE